METDRGSLKGVPGDPLARPRISRSTFLEILRARLANPLLEPNEFTSLARLYAEVAGWKERIRARKNKKPNEKRTLDDFILAMEKTAKEKK